MLNSLSQRLNEFRSGRVVRAAIAEGIFFERHELRPGSSLDVSLIHDFTGGRAQNNVQAQVFLEKRIDEYQSAGGDLTRLNGRSLLNEIVELFNRDTIRTKGEKLKTFYTRSMSDFKRGMDLVTALERDSIELIRLGEFDINSVEPKLIDRFIDAINDEPRYLGLVGHLRSQREDIINGLTWIKVKSIVKKDDIDRDTDRLRKAKRSRDTKDNEH
jgi:hypothetical protein